MIFESPRARYFLKEAFKSLLSWVVFGAVVLGVLLAKEANAQTSTSRVITIAYTPPTKWEDGSTLTDPISYRVYRGACGGSKSLVATPGAGTLSVQVPGTVAGQCFVVTAVARNIESDDSAEVRFPGKPGAPGTVTVTIVTTQVTSP